MTQRDNILQELNELKSSLANASSQNVYEVPDGYFDNLIGQVMLRIKALDADSAVEELNHLSPLLNSISKEMPYAVPLGFFNGLAEQAIKAASENNETPAEELATLSPLLSRLKKETPYAVPEGYFEQLSSSINTETVKPAAKVVPITRQKWFRYAAAAVVISFVAIAGFLIFNRSASNDPKKEPFAWVEKNLKKVSSDDLDSFVQLTETSAAFANVDVKTETEVKNLIKDIPDSDIQEFLDDMQIDEPANNDDVLMN